MKEGPLKLYVNKALVAPGVSYTTLLYPFWGLGADKKNILYFESSLAEHGFDPACFELVNSPEEAEYVLVPHEYWRLKAKRPDLLQKMIDEAQQHGKPLLVDASGDVAGKVNVPNAKILRINQYRFELPEDEVKVPVPCEDLLETYCSGQLSLRDKSSVPTVGFVGWGRLAFKQRMRSLVKEIPLRIRALFDSRQRAKIKGVFWRERANKIFAASSRVQTNFIIRSSYSGNTATLQGEREKNRREFVENILESDYSLVIRGDANEATRFYEVLSLGRIPVLIDTAVVLPLENLIDYKEFCVIIDWKDLDKSPDILADFHASLTKEQFIKMQERARFVFEHYLRYDSFSPHLVELLRSQLSDN